jgi:hypothetical protein
MGGRGWIQVTVGRDRLRTYFQHGGTGSTVKNSTMTTCCSELLCTILSATYSKMKNSQRFFYIHVPIILIEGCIQFVMLPGGGHAAGGAVG